MGDKFLPVEHKFDPITVSVPERFQHCDMVEIRVVLTPLTWQQEHERYNKSEHGEIVGSQIVISRLEARDSRMVVGIARQMFRELAMRWLGLKDIW